MGVSLGAAVSYSHLLTPEAQAADAHASDLYAAPPPPDVTAATVSGTLRKRSLRSLRRRGRVVADLVTSEAATLTCSLLLEKPPSGTTAKTVVLATSIAEAQKAGPVAVTLKLTRGGRRKLKKRKSAALTLTVQSKDRHGNTGVATLKRRFR